MLQKVNFSNKRIISFIGILFVLVALPLSIYFAQKAQDIRQRALEPIAWCTPADGTEIYSYVPGALEIYVHVIEANGDIGLIPGVYLRADKIGNNEGTGVNTPRNRSGGEGCGFSAEGITDGNGHMNLEPLNCHHNNFRVSHGDRPSGLPPDVVFVHDGSTYQPDGNDQNNVQTGVDISNLELWNGYAGILKLYYRRNASIPPTPTPTPVPPGIPTPTPTRIPTPTPTTQVACPLPTTVTNIRIDCPYCP